MAGWRLVKGAKASFCLPPEPPTSHGWGEGLALQAAPHAGGEPGALPDPGPSPSSVLQWGPLTEQTSKITAVMGAQPMF